MTRRYYGPLVPRLRGWDEGGDSVDAVPINGRDAHAQHRARVRAANDRRQRAERIAHDLLTGIRLFPCFADDYGESVITTATSDDIGEVA